MKLKDQDHSIISSDQVLVCVTGDMVDGEENVDADIIRSVQEIDRQ